VQQLRAFGNRSITFDRHDAATPTQDAEPAWHSPHLEIREVFGGVNLEPDRRHRIFLPTRGAFVFRSHDEHRVVADAVHIFVVAPGRRFEVGPLGQACQARGLLVTPSEQLIQSLPTLNPIWWNLRSPYRVAKMPHQALLHANRIHVLAKLGDQSPPAEIAAELVRLAFAAAPLPRAAQSSPVIDKIKIQIHDNCHQRSALQDLAAEAGKSCSLLTQMFTRSQGLPLYQYQLNVRLGAALAELVHCQSITDIAYGAGFSSHSHFTARFKRTFGMNPSQCRLYLTAL
jgi:AraC-like DNA-binding protein